LVERAGEIDGGAVADGLGHADDAVNVFGDCFCLLFTKTGIENHTFDCVFENAKQPA
jgi:hypothetical protein